MVYCSVALCRNGNRNRADLSFFRFPTDKRLSIWLKFCRRADSKFKEEQRKAITGKENNLRICNEHFTDDSYQKTLNGRRTLSDYAIPAVFRIYNKPETTARNEHYEKRAEKRTLPRESDVKTTKKAKAQSAANTSTADIGSIHNDHTYAKTPSSDHVSEGTLAKNRSLTGTQTDVTLLNVQQWEDDQEELIRLRKENEELRQKLQDNPTIKRDLFMEDVLKSDESVRFYTGVPSLSCLQMLSELLRPEAEKLKYWDRNKGKTMAYQTSGKKKPGPKRVLKVEEEFVMTLVRLRLGLMGRHLADIFSVSPSQVSRIVTTWVCFLSATFKETLLLWPSKEEVRGKQFSRAATKSTRQIACVRIHVERAIERLKDFKIFQGNIPLTLVPLANHLLIVCGGLCNLLEPLA
ncbi:uncharacterized protein LOC114965177 [Acropora millepora]|uniref:uncharacterized protein LOC114965177 n=1 Tax=Acropora millepora TaxID=45264 RepID=UPI001CF2A408|nr:uncharacterized protein LOC114965177 [Acropora millepora]